MRLDHIRALPECRLLLAPLDQQGLLDAASEEAHKFSEEGDDDALLAELGVEAPSGEDDDISKLKHVKPRAEVRAAEDIASRTPCKDFDRFKPLFLQTQQEIKSGARETRRFEKDASVVEGEFLFWADRCVMWTRWVSCSSPTMTARTGGFA